MRDDNFPYKQLSIIRQEIVNDFHISLVGSYLRNNQSIILEKVEAVQTKRQTALRFAKKINPDIQIILIFVNTNESEILSRLEQRDSDCLSEARGISIYTDGQKPVLELQIKDEADYIFLLNDSKNEKEIQYIINTIKNIRN